MKQPATLPTLRRQGAALTVLALAVVLAALAGLFPLFQQHNNSKL